MPLQFWAWTQKWKNSPRSEAHWIKAFDTDEINSSNKLFFWTTLKAAASLALLYLTHKPCRGANGPHAPLIIEVDKHMLLHDKLHRSHHMLTPDKHPAINDHIC